MYYPCCDSGKLPPFSTKKYLYSLMVHSFFPMKKQSKINHSIVLMHMWSIMAKDILSSLNEVLSKSVACSSYIFSGDELNGLVEDIPAVDMR